MNKKSKLLYDGIILLGIVLVCFAGVKIYERHADLKASNDLYEELNEQYVWGPEQILAYTGGLNFPEENASQESDVPGEETSVDMPLEIREIPWYRLVRVNFERLKERNSDVVGWIFFENEDISYPIVYSGNNTKYLRRSFDGKYATAGSIFLDGENTPDLEDSRIVIYGHKMNDLSMFGKLKYYMQDEDYYEDHQYFQILVEGIVYRYQIFSYFDVLETETEMCRVDFTSEKDFSDFINVLLKRSVKDTGIEVNRYDRVVTLLTCSSEGKRTLVNAVMVEYYDIEAREQEQMKMETLQ